MSSVSLSARVPARHLWLAVLVVAIWGSNFAIIKIGLNTLPPLFFAALRFGFAALPAVFFVPRPQVPWRNVITYGLLLGVGQFGVLFWAMQSHITAGLASLLMQLQVFFTLVLAVLIAGERLRAYQVLACLIAAVGIAVIALHTDSHTTPLGIALVVFAALCWGLANMTARRAGRITMLPYMVWACAFATPPLLLLAWLSEGQAAILQGLRAWSWQTTAVVLWQSWANTIFGFGVWAWLLNRYVAASIVPLSLLVPVFGMSAAALLLAEPLPLWKLLAAAFIICGLVLNLFWPAVSARWRQNS